MRAAKRPTWVGPRAPIAQRRKSQRVRRKGQIWKGKRSVRGLRLLLLFACKWLGLFWIARKYTRHRLRIICYHGFELEDESSFRPKLYMRRRSFERRLETIRRLEFAVLPLEEAIERLSQGTLPANAIAITADDGFHSFHEIAAPLLTRFGYPATVYVTTYYVEHSVPIFRLAIQYMFWKTRKSELRLQGVVWSPNGSTDLADEVQAKRVMWDCIHFGERHCTEEQRQRLCELLGELLEVPYESVVRSKVVSLMTPDHLRQLARSNVSIELHTHRHTFPAEESMLGKKEIADNRAALARWLGGAERRHFCYPSGLWNKRQWNWLGEVNIGSATTCVPGLNHKETPRYALRRFLDGENIHQLEFEAALSGLAPVNFGRRA
jgi:peptidoglycan/xylan/chitin deacetylase (PgdA/CDA1 family)